jgi:hypothetical protein
MTTQSDLTASHINISSNNVFTTIMSSIITLALVTITLIIGFGNFTPPRIVVAGVGGWTSGLSYNS